MSLKKRFALMAIPAAIALALTACGGGDGEGSTTSNGGSASGFKLTGTAAIGAPLSGATVEASCQQGQGTATSNAQGTFIINVANGAGPCILRTFGTYEGTQFELFGAAQADGTANVTPLTTLIVSGMFGSSQIDPAALTPVMFDGAWTNIQSLLSSMGVSFPAFSGSQSPLNAPFDAAFGDPMDDALEALQNAGVTPTLISNGLTAGFSGLTADLQAAVNKVKTDKDNFNTAASEDEAKRASCVEENNPEHGSCWRTEELGKAQGWGDVTEADGVKEIALGSGKHTIKYNASTNIMELGQFGRTFSTEGGFTVQACDQSAAGPALRYQLISPRAVVVTEAEWDALLQQLANSPDGENTLSFTMQAKCTVLSGEDPNATFGNTSSDRLTLVVNKTGNAIMQGTGSDQFTDAISSLRLRNWLFRGQNFTKDDNWATFAKMYKYPSHDGDVYAIAVNQVETDATTPADRNDMFGTALFIEWDGFK